MKTKQTTARLPLDQNQMGFGFTDVTTAKLLGDASSAAEPQLSPETGTGRDKQHTSDSPESDFLTAIPHTMAFPENAKRIPAKCTSAAYRKKAISRDGMVRVDLKVPRSVHRLVQNLVRRKQLKSTQAGYVSALQTWSELTASKGTQTS